MKRFLIVSGLVCGGWAVATAAPTTLPAGLYGVSGVALSSSSSVYCPLKKGQTLTGAVDFPGSGKQAFEMNYFAVNPGGDIEQVRFYAFPAVPTSGLNGWTDKQPAGTDVETFRNGKVVSGPGNTGSVAFDLQPVIDGLPVSIGGKMNVEIVTSGACQQSYTILLQRIGPYTESH